MVDWTDARKMYEEGHGTSKIGEKYGAASNTVRRGLIKLGVKMRTQSEAQKLQLDNGFLTHPTKGTKRPESVKAKIGVSTQRAYENMSEAEKKRLKKQSKQRWEDRTPDQVEEMKTKAAKGIRKASLEGSKLERFLVDKISESGRQVVWHASNFLENTNLEVDLLLPNDKIAVEVDGVFHFQAIFSEEQYQKTVVADTEKNGLLLKNGYCVIRIRNTKKNTSNTIHEQLWLELKKTLDSINKKFPPVTERLFYLEV